MKKVIRLLSNAIDRIVRIVVIMLVALAFLFTLYQVFSRYVLLSVWVKETGLNLSNLNYPWLEELIRYLFVWAVFLGVGVVYKAKGHAQVEMIMGILSEKWRNILVLLSEVVNALFFVILFFKGLQLMQVANGQLSPSLGINMSVMYISIISCASICFIHALCFIFHTPLKVEKVKKSKSISSGVESTG